MKGVFWRASSGPYPACGRPLRLGRAETSWIWLKGTWPSYLLVLTLWDAFPLAAGIDRGRSLLGMTGVEAGRTARGKEDDDADVRDAGEVH